MAGFYTRDNQGRITFQLTDRIVRLLGSVEINSGNTSGFVDIPAGMLGQPFYYCSFSRELFGKDYADQSTSLSGRRVSWSKMPVGSVIVFGVY